MLMWKVLVRVKIVLLENNSEEFIKSPEYLYSYSESSSNSIT